MQPQRVELVGGVAASTCGFLGLTAVLFAPLSWVGRVFPDYRFLPYNLTGSSLAVGPNGLQLGWVFHYFGIPLALSALLLVVIGVGAVAHSTRHAQFGRILLWSSTGGLLLVIFLADVPSINIYLLPSILLALIASVASYRGRREQGPVTA